MDTKHMIFSLCSLAIAGGTIVGVSAVTVESDQPAVVLPEQRVDVLKNATAECLAKVDSVCPADNVDCKRSIQCGLVEVQDGSRCVAGPVDDKSEPTLGVCEKMTGWSCNGAYMPQAVQDCLGEAARVEVKAPAEGVIKP